MEKREIRNTEEVTTPRLAVGPPLGGGYPSKKKGGKWGGVVERSTQELDDGNLIITRKETKKGEKEKKMRLDRTSGGAWILCDPA